jgi:hypothetical protein
VLSERLGAVPDDAIAMYDLGAVSANLGSPSDALSWWARARAATSDPSLVSMIDAATARLQDPVR